MSGPLVPVIGGPYDGQEAHLVTYKKRQQILYEAGDWSRGSRTVHVYESEGDGAPLIYQGTRDWRPNKDVVLPNTQGLIGGGFNPEAQ